ncbi:MAG: FtsW/RodA/SpoVE family cell cycle protein [Bacilli bacterium]|nr:FtsW/RodA/SpoVE family cell cycle protein [Bacilli bacterium]
MKNTKRFISNMDVPLLIASLVLFIFGLLNIVNASSQAVALRYGTGIYYYFYRQLLFIIAGLIATLFIIKIPTKKYYNMITFVYFVEVGLLMYLFLYGKSHMGSINWIDLGHFKLQPSEFAKPIMIVSLSLLMERFSSKLNNNKKYTRSDHYKLIGIIIIIGLLFAGFVFLEKDLGTTIILLGIFSVMFISSPIQNVEKVQTITFMIIAFFIGLIIMSVKSNGHILSEAQMARFDFYDPCSKYEEGGYQICNGFIAINSGGLLGVGIGNSKQVSYIPESHTDSVFAIIAEEYGFIVCTGLFIIYLIVLYRIFNLACRVSNIRGKFICLGIGTYLALHILINLGGLFGSIPLTGVPLPYLSYGGSFTLSLMVSLAIVQRICIEKNTEKIKIR